MLLDSNVSPYYRIFVNVMIMGRGHVMIMEKLFSTFCD